MKILGKTVSRRSSQPVNDQSKHGEREGQSFGLALRDLAGGTAVYAYFGGWVYAFYYYEAFNVRLYALDIPLQYFFVFAFSAFDTLWGFLLILGVIAALSLLGRYYPSRFWLAIVLLGLFLGTFYVSRSEGQKDASQKRFAYDGDHILLYFKGSSQDSQPPDLVYNNKANRLRQLVETKDRLIVYYQPNDVAGVTPPTLIYEIERSELTSVQKVVVAER
jgi:hypothetical protein